MMQKNCVLLVYCYVPNFGIVAQHLRGEIDKKHYKVNILLATCTPSTVNRPIVTKLVSSHCIVYNCVFLCRHFNRHMQSSPRSAGRDTYFFLFGKCGKQYNEKLCISCVFCASYFKMGGTVRLQDV